MGEEEREREKDSTQIPVVCAGYTCTNKGVVTLEQISLNGLEFISTDNTILPQATNQTSKLLNIVENKCCVSVCVCVCVCNYNSISTGNILAWGLPHQNHCTLAYTNK